MKKILYGIFVLYCGFIYKNFKKNDLKYQSKLISRIQKYTAMLLIIPLLVACEVLENQTPILPKAQQPVLMNWKGPVEAQIKQKELEANPSFINNSSQTTTSIDLTNYTETLTNRSFELPLIQEIQRIDGGIEGWNVSKRSIELINSKPSWNVHAEGYQSVNLMDGEIEQKFSVIPNTRYYLSLAIKADTECSPDVVEADIFWNDNVIKHLKTALPDWRVHEEVIFNDKDTLATLKFYSKAKGSCGMGLDNISLKYKAIEPVAYSTPEVPNAQAGESVLPIPTPTIDPNPTPIPFPDLQVTPTPISTQTPQSPLIIPENIVTPVPTRDPNPTPQVGTKVGKYDINREEMTLTTGNSIDYTSGPKIDGDKVSFTGTVITKEEPQVIQLWNTDGSSNTVKESDARHKPEECSSEQPSIFFRKPPEVGFEYQIEEVEKTFDFCVNLYNVVSKNTVPWETATTWTYDEATGVFTFEGNKLAGAKNEHVTVNKYVIIAIGSQGLMSRKTID